MTSRKASHTAFVAFGSNLGRRRSTIERALRALGELDGAHLRRVSKLYETDPVGGPSRQRAYLNGVVELEWAGRPEELLRRLRAVELRFGRRRVVQWGPRTLDLDLLAFGRRTSRSPRLTLPHPRYHERRFVLAPFCDLAPRFRHPRLKVENRSLLRSLTPSGQRVTIIGTWKNSRFSPSRKRSSNARPSSP